MQNNNEEVWDVYMASYEEGIPGSTMVRMDLLKDAPFENYPYLIVIGVSYQTNREDLLPEPKDFDIFYKLADDTLALIQNHTQVIHAGTFTTNGRRYNYYYVQNTSSTLEDEISNYFKTNFEEIDYILNIEEDKEWNAYLNFLYPNEAIYNYMSIQKVLRGLQESGDNLSQPRPINHWLYFQTEEERTKMIERAIEESFQVEHTDFNDELNSYSLQISRTDDVHADHLYSVTNQLREYAKELNGIYDGWETTVIRD